jgi:2-methylcitrate dehydratase PrpD
VAAVSVLEQLGEVLVRMQPPSAGTRERLGIHVLDTIGACIAGFSSTEGLALQDLCHHGLSAMGATPLDLIALRSAATRLTEIDDIHLPSCTTAGAVVLATATVLAQQLPATSADDFALALQAGYELMTRLGLAIRGPEILYRGIWPTYFVAPLGAAAVTARLLRLNATQSARALALALTLSTGAPGAASHSGQNARWLQLGWAARSGTAAALAAARGYGCDCSLLDGDFLARTHGIECDIAALPNQVSADHGAIFALSIKPYCAAKQCIAAMQALRTLLDGGIAVDDIVAIRVEVPPSYAGMLAHADPASSRLGRIASVSYQLALVALRRDLLQDIHRADLSGDPAIAGFMRLTVVAPDESLAVHYPRHWPARVEVSLRNGRCERCLVSDAEGDPTHAFGRETVLAKFRALTQVSLGLQRADALAEDCLASVSDDGALQRLCAKLHQMASFRADSAEGARVTAAAVTRQTEL